MDDRSGAEISGCGLYRYRLWRHWGDDAQNFVAFVMLNPSTADARIDDPTIRRCIGYAKEWGRHGIEIINLFGLRATNPKELKGAVDPVGPDNMDAISTVADIAQFHHCPFICAWGTGGTLMGHDQTVLGWIHEAAPSLIPMCLGTTKGGHPRHPLYLKRTARMEPFEDSDR